MTTSIDVTKNAQYTALKDSYDKGIDKNQQVEDLWKDLNDTQDTLRYTSCPSPEADKLSQRYQDDMDKISSPGLDPDGSIRTQIVSGQDPVAMMKDQETKALSALSSVLLGKDDLDKANKDAQQMPPSPPPPINITVNNYGHHGAHGRHGRHHGSLTPGDEPGTTRGTHSRGGTSGGGSASGSGNVPSGGSASGSGTIPGGGSTNGGSSVPGGTSVPGGSKTTGTGGTGGASGPAGVPVNGGSEVTGGAKPLDFDSEDVETRASFVLMTCGQNADGVANGYMDILDDGTATQKQCNDLESAVRAKKPGGTSSDATGTISQDMINQAKALGVTLPDDMASIKPDKNGDFSIKQSDFDTFLNNIQGQSSDVTTGNQELTIKLNKMIDLSEQSKQFETSKESSLQSLRMSVARGG